MSKTMHAYGPIFRCKGPALDPEYVGKMFTVKDLKHQVRLFYNRKNVMKINENHKGSRAEVGVVHHMWVDANKRLMVHVEIQSRNPYSRARIKNLIEGETVGLSMETAGDEVVLPTGLLAIHNKRITGIATTDTPDHKETFIEYANVSPDKVLKKAFKSGYGSKGDTSARPLALGNRLKKRIKSLFKNKKEEEEEKEKEGKAEGDKEEEEEKEKEKEEEGNPEKTEGDKEEEKEGNPEKTVRDKEEQVGNEEVEKDSEENKPHEENTVADPMDVDDGAERGSEKNTGESSTQILAKKPEPPSKADRKNAKQTPSAAKKDDTSQNVSNNKNVSDFNKQPSKAAKPTSQSGAHSHSTSQPEKAQMSEDKNSMDTDDQRQEEEAQKSTSDPSDELNRILEENAKLKKRLRDEEGSKLGSQAKRQRTGLSPSEEKAETYKMTAEDNKKDWGETQRAFNEYLSIKGMAEEGDREMFDAFVKKQMAKKLKKAKKNLEFFNEQLEEDLKQFDITEAEKDNIRKLATDTKGNPEAAAAIQSLAYATKAHRGSMMSHRASEQNFQSRQENRFKMHGNRGQVAQATSSVSSRGPSVMDQKNRSSLLSVTMGRFRPGFKAPDQDDSMDVDSTFQNNGHLGLSSREAARAKNIQSAPDRQAFMPTVKREIPSDDILSNLKPILDRYGMDSLKVDPITRRFNTEILRDNKDETLQRFYDHFRTGVPKNAASSISGKNFQFDTSGASSIELRQGATSWMPIHGDRRAFL